MNFMTTYLADATANPDMFSVKALLAILTGIGTLGGTAFGFHKLGTRSHSVKLKNDPLNVAMEDTPVLRREFDSFKADVTSFKAEIRNDVTEMKGLFRLTMAAVESSNQDTNGKLERQSERLTEAIEESVKEGRLGRVALWNKVGPVGERLAAVEATSDVSNQIGKLADALKQNHGKNPPSR